VPTAILPPKLEQSALNQVAKGQSKSCTATFQTPTSPGNLIVVIATVGGGNSPISSGPAGFTFIRTVAEDTVQISTWYLQNAPATTSVNVTISKDRSLQVRAMEYSGAAHTNCLDQVISRTDDSDFCRSGNTPITAQADEIVVAAIANGYASCSQQGFSGGLVRLFESTSPQAYTSYRTNYNSDFDRHRCTVHHTITAATGSFFISGKLSSAHEWVAILMTFRGSSTGARALSSTKQGPVARCGTGGRGRLDNFAPLVSVNEPPVLITTGGTGSIIQPFNYQYLIGVNKFLIGSSTKYKVEGTSGLNGWTVRTSDDDNPRSDGAQRGIDLESARVVTFTLNVGKTRDDVELNMDALFRQLVPQRDEDWPLIWRHPTQPAKMMMVRPTDILRDRNAQQLLYAKQTFALRAADPRHYSAVPKRVFIPNGGSANVTNEGNIAAYPVIMVQGPSTGPPLTRVTLTNETALVSWDVIITVPYKSVLIGDMQARITGSGKSSITLDGQSRYGSWQLPRSPFRIDPDPSGQSGYNKISLTTVPAGIPITCTLDYRDTWAG
jgi:hypothetical protein